MHEREQPTGHALGHLLCQAEKVQHKFVFGQSLESVEEECPLVVQQSLTVSQAQPMPSSFHNSSYTLLKCGVCLK